MPYQKGLGMSLAEILMAKPVHHQQHQAPAVVQIVQALERRRVRLALQAGRDRGHEIDEAPAIIVGQMRFRVMIRHAGLAVRRWKN